VRTWALVSQKGGSGRSTLTVHLAVAAVEAGKTVLVVDIDPQKNALRWSSVRGKDKPPLIIGAIVPELDRILANAETQGADLAIIDTSPRADRDSIEIARKSDVVIVPARASIFDIPAAEDTMELLKAAGMDSKAVIVLNAIAARTHEGEDAAAFLKEKYGLEPFRIGERTDFRQALNNGLGITEYTPKSKATQELLNLYNAIERLTL
jgi:chromosome partitioning protein